jgi:hypothetical protein
MAQPLFSAGTSRGGTTFLARILSLNSQISMASDPFLPMFKRLRNKIYEQSGLIYPKDAPTSDYYFSTQHLDLLKLLHNSNLKNITVNSDEVTEIRMAVQKRMSLASPELIPAFNNLNGANFYELFRNGIELMASVYQSEQNDWVGFNDNWVSDYFPLFAKAFPDAKFISIIRDVRGAISSMTKLSETRPELIPPMYNFVRSWRKHVDLSISYKSDALFKDRFHIVKYEDLASNPKETISNLCKFLNVEFSEQMLETEKFRPFKGDKWEPYSHFNDVPQTGIFQIGIDRWKSFLDQDMISFIEHICSPELKYLGYELTQLPYIQIPQPIAKKVKNDYDKALGWKLPIDDFAQEFVKELNRNQSLQHNSIPVVEMELNFLRSSCFKQINEKLYPLN